MTRRRGGLTCFELVAIVLILVPTVAVIPLLFGGTHSGKSDETKCLNNLKQMGVAVQMYEDDYEGGILPWRMGNPGTDPARRHLWSDLIKPYLQQLRKGTTNTRPDMIKKIFRCPSAPEEVAAVQDECHGIDYGYNPYLTKSVTPSKIQYPSLTLRVTETAVYEYDVHKLPHGVKDAGYRGGSVFCPMPKGRLKGSTLNPQAPGWHNGYQNCLWVDGHVSSITWQEVMYTDSYKGTTDPNAWYRLSPKSGHMPKG